jgi:putative phage-type endonuclease
MNRVTHNVTQGSAEWLAVRAKHFTASELSAAAGKSKYQSRQALIKAKATGLVEEVSPATQRLFDAGHAAEAAARPIVEAMLGEDLFPVTMSCEIDGLPLLASLDGITMLGDSIWENKLLNESLKSSIQQGKLDDHYALQIEQQLLVSGATKCYFTTSDGTEAGTFGMWYESNPDLRNQIVAIWKQFEKDLANYEPTEEKRVLVADVVKCLPAVMVQVSGSVSIVDNFAMFEVALRDFVDNKLVRSPQTDQDFVDLDEQIKSLKKAEDALNAAEVQMIAQVASVDSMKRTKDMLHKLARDNRLMAEKLLKAEKENRKAELVAKTKEAFGRHLVTLIERSGEGMAHMITPNFAGEIAGLKSLDSMRDKLSVALANAKVDANAMADRVDANRRTVEDMTLFPDFAQVCTKAPDDFAALLAMRTAARKEAEEKRLAEERERIRAEEQAKAQREAAEVLRKQQEAEAAKVDEQRPIAKPDAPTVVSVIEPANDGGQMIKLGEINAALGITVTADFLDRLGIKATIEKNAKLYPAAKFPTICRLIADHILAQAFKKAA